MSGNAASNFSSSGFSPSPAVPVTRTADEPPPRRSSSSAGKASIPDGLGGEDAEAETGDAGSQLASYLNASSATLTDVGDARWRRGNVAGREEVCVVACWLARCNSALYHCVAVARAGVHAPSAAFSRARKSAVGSDIVDRSVFGSEMETAASKGNVLVFGAACCMLPVTTASPTSVTVTRGGSSPRGECRISARVASLESGGSLF
jgi:hypothetical protein